jgi:hypothetical protein
MVIAPHPDDETLGVGGILLKKKSEGESIGWLTVTSISEKHGWNKEQVEKRRHEIASITQFYNFDFASHLDFPTAQLDSVSRSKLVSEISARKNLSSANHKKNAFLFSTTKTFKKNFFLVNTFKTSPNNCQKNKLATGRNSLVKSKFIRPFLEK